MRKLIGRISNYNRLRQKIECEHEYKRNQDNFVFIYKCSTSLCTCDLYDFILYRLIRKIDKKIEIIAVKKIIRYSYFIFEKHILNKHVKNYFSR